MPTGLNGRDKPAGNGGRHAELLSALDSHDLASTIDPVEDSDTADSDIDQRADPADMFHNLLRVAVRHRQE